MGYIAPPFAQEAACRCRVNLKYIIFAQQQQKQLTWSASGPASLWRLQRSWRGSRHNVLYNRTQKMLEEM